jgi:hypothetical protein
MYVALSGIIIDCKLVQFAKQKLPLKLTGPFAVPLLNSTEERPVQLLKTPLPSVKEEIEFSKEIEVKLLKPPKANSPMF